MIRWSALVLGVIVALAAIVFSGINLDPARLDLLFTAIQLPLGVIVLLSMLVGALLGGAALYLGVVVPLRLRLARQRRDLKVSNSMPSA